MSSLTRYSFSKNAFVCWVHSRLRLMHPRPHAAHTFVMSKVHLLIPNNHIGFILLVMPPKVQSLFATTPIVAVRLTPTEVEWVFRFEVLQHCSGGAGSSSAYVRSSYGAAASNGSSSDRNDDHADGFQQGYTRHHESAVATVRALLEAIVSVLFVEGVPLTVSTSATRMWMTMLPTSASPRKAVAGLKHLCMQVSSVIYTLINN